MPPLSLPFPPSHRALMLTTLPYLVSIYTILGPLVPPYSFKLEATQSRERIVEAAQQEIAQVKSMYEEKLGALASRISDMESHHAQEKAGSAEQRQGWEEKEQRIHADYAGRMHKYQSALKTMAKREPHFTEAISKLTRSNEQLSQEVDRLTNGLESAQEAARRAAAELEELRSERESTKRQAADEEVRSRAGMAELKQQHASELASIDKKVRELVEKKDATISALRTDVSKLRRDKQAMETFLKDLNAGIRAPTTTQRTR